MSTGGLFRFARSVGTGVRPWLLGTASEDPGVVVRLDFGLCLPAWIMRDVLHVSDVFGAWDLSHEKPRRGLGSRTVAVLGKGAQSAARTSGVPVRGLSDRARYQNPTAGL